MNANGDMELSESVARFVAEEIGVRRYRITAGSRLREDLGVDGDDAYDLLIAFAEKFHVRNGGFVFSDHFGPEATWNPIAFLFPRRRLLPLTIHDLVNSAAVGVWRVSSKAGSCLVD